MFRLLTRFVMVAALALTGVGLASTATAATPPAVVVLDGVGVLGRFDSAVVSGTTRCRSGSVEPELVVTLTQGGESGSIALSNIVCDGRTHRFTTSLMTDPLGGPFLPGEAWIEARLTVHEPVMHDPLPQGYDANAMWLRPSAKVTPVWPVVLGADGNLRVTVNALCRGPWATESISVQVLQGPDTQVDGSAYVSHPDVPCDGAVHRVTLVVDPAPGATFVAKPVLLVLHMQIWDEADTGDPINGVGWEGQVRVVRR